MDSATASGRLRLEDSLPTNGNGDSHAIQQLGTQVEVLRTGMSELRTQFQESRTSTNTRMDQLGSATSARFDQITALIQQKFDGQQAEAKAAAIANKTPWGLIVGLFLSAIFGGFTVTTSLVVGAYFITQQQTQVQISPIQSDIKAGARDFANLAEAVRLIGDWQRSVDKSLEGNASTDAASLKDREDKGQAIGRLQGVQSELVARLGAVFERLCEVETQFAYDQNEQLKERGYQQRLNGVLWRRSFHEDLPPLVIPTQAIAAGKPCQR